MTLPSQIWHAPAPDDMRVEAIDGLTLIYHHKSGLTHLLAEPLPQILALIGQQGASVDDLIGRLRDEFEVVDPEGLDSRVRECLSQLAALGLTSPS